MIDFDLPDSLVAQEPVSPRDAARLLVYDRRTKQIVDAVFRDVATYLPDDSTLVLNNSKVEHCRWLFNGGRVEILVLEKLDQHAIRAMVRPGKRFKVDSTLQLTDWLTVDTTAVDDDGLRTLKLSVQHDDERLNRYTHVPLPPYIAQNDALAGEYQTVYAKPLGSKAAPTAGLHFTPRLLDVLKKQHELLEVTLHVGLGTFAPLKDDNYRSGTLHKESYEISAAVESSLRSADHITAVGTTTVRTLESWKSLGKTHGDTDIFIQPGYEFRAVDSLITNFHLPGTSLLLMIEAFIGSSLLTDPRDCPITTQTTPEPLFSRSNSTNYARSKESDSSVRLRQARTNPLSPREAKDETQRIYNHAIKEKYRFYSFGDAMLVL